MMDRKNNEMNKDRFLFSAKVSNSLSTYEIV